MRLLALLLVSLLPACQTSGPLQYNDGLTTTSEVSKLLLRGNVLANLRSPVTSTRLGVGMALQRAEEAVRGNIPFTLSGSPRTKGVPGSQEFSDSLTALGLPEPTLGSLEFFVDGDEFFPALESEIKHAKRSMDLQIYIWDNDDISVRIADQVISRSPEVPVRILMDDLGSVISASLKPETPPPPNFRAPANMVDYLRAADSSLEVRRILNPWLIMDHTKMLIFDRESAFLGGMNIGREYYNEWHDLMVRVRGPIIEELHPGFEKAWRRAHPLGDFAFLTFDLPFLSKRHQQPVPPNAVPLRVLRTNLLEGQREPLVAMLEAIRASQERIWIENEYITSDRIIDALIGAKKRGVDVRVIIGDLAIERIMDLANLREAGRLLRAGIAVYRHPLMTHMKVMICDQWATVGAANLDTNSLQVNHEINLSFSDPRAIRALEERVFRKDFVQSRKLTLEDTRNILNPLIEPLADQL